MHTVWKRSLVTHTQKAQGILYVFHSAHMPQATQIQRDEHFSYVTEVLGFQDPIDWLLGLSAGFLY